MALSQPADEVLSLIFTIEDVEDIAEANNVPLDVAEARAREWAPYIAATATTLINQQLEGAIIENQP